MSRHKGVQVRILNPASGCGYTSRKCAERYVRRGMARWVKDDSGRDCLEFVADGGMSRIIAASVTRETAYDRAAHTGMATLSELANLPMVAPGVALGFGRRKGASKNVFLTNQGR
jgi:hypothetical protein